MSAIGTGEYVEMEERASVPSKATQKPAKEWRGRSVGSKIADALPCALLILLSIGFFVARGTLEYHKGTSDLLLAGGLLTGIAGIVTGIFMWMIAKDEEQRPNARIPDPVDRETSVLYQYCEDPATPWQRHLNQYDYQEGEVR